MARKSCFLLILPLLFLFIAGGQSSTRLNFYNQCTHTVWLSASPSIGLLLAELEPESLTYLETPDKWTGSFWARTGSFWAYIDSLPNDFHCDTGDCGSRTNVCDAPPPQYPVTLINMAIEGTRVAYEVSLNHGYNVPLRISPVDGSKSCPTVDCTRDLMNVCPSPLVFTNKGGWGVACKSACDGFNEPKFCCTGEYSSPEACKPNRFSLAFKQLCPLAVTYPRDNSPPISQCPTLANFNITFCPV